MSGLFPFVRIGLYALAGYLAGQGADSWVVDYIRTDPDLAAAVVGAGLTSVGHNNMQPYRARYVIRRTARIWVLSPY